MKQSKLDDEKRADTKDKLDYLKQKYPKHADKFFNLRNLTHKESDELKWLIKPRCANGHEYNYAGDTEYNKNIIGNGQPCDAKTSSKCLGTIKTTTFYFCDGDSCKAKHYR